MIVLASTVRLVVSYASENISVENTEKFIVPSTDFKIDCKSTEMYRTLGILRNHKEKVHEGVNYPCKRYDYKATCNYKNLFFKIPSK